MRSLNEPLGRESGEHRETIELWPIAAVKRHWRSAGIALLFALTAVEIYALLPAVPAAAEIASPAAGVTQAANAPQGGFSAAAALAESVDAQQINGPFLPCGCWWSSR